MSGVLILATFFADQITQAQQQVDQTKSELEKATDDQVKTTLRQQLVKAQAYLDVATKTKELFDNNRLNERQLKSALQSLRGGTNG